MEIEESVSEATTLVRKILVNAVRQYKHNDGSEGFVTGLDYDETVKAVADLLRNAKIFYRLPYEEKE